jgi:hypothetical protein
MREQKTVVPVNRIKVEPANGWSAAQRNVPAAIDRSPRQLAQRQRLRSLFGEAARLPEAVRTPTQDSPHRSARSQLPAAPVLQRTAIHVNDKLLQGSDTEDTEIFWQKLDEEYGHNDAVYAAVLRDIVKDIQSRDDEEESEWDGRVLMAALQNLQSLSGYQPKGPLGEWETKTVTGLLLGGDLAADEPISPEQVTSKGLSLIVEELVDYAAKEYKGSTSGTTRTQTSARPIRHTTPCFNVRSLTYGTLTASR